MRDYGKIETKYWEWADINDLSMFTKLLGVYLLSNQYCNSIGVYRLKDGAVITDLETDPETLSKGFAELFRNRFIYRCSSTKYVMIRDFLKHNPPENPNVGKAMAKAVSLIPRDFTYWPELIKQIERLGERFPKGLIDDLETLSKPFRNPEPEPEPEPEPLPEEGSVSEDTGDADAAPNKEDVEEDVEVPILFSLLLPPTDKKTGEDNYKSLVYEYGLPYLQEHSVKTIQRSTLGQMNKMCGDDTQALWGVFVEAHDQVKPMDPLTWIFEKVTVHDDTVFDEAAVRAAEDKLYADQEASQ